MDIGINIGTIIVALIVSVVAPSLLASFSSSQRRREKEQDYAREDKLAHQAREDSIALLASNERIAQITFAAGRTTQGTLEIIHKLVNSKLTDEKQERYESLVTLEASLNRESELLKGKGLPIPEKTSDLLKSTREQIVALGAELAERRKQQVTVDKQVQNLADQLAQNGFAAKPYPADVLAPVKPPAPSAVDPQHVPTVEAPVRVIVPGSGEKADSTVEKK